MAHSHTIGTLGLTLGLTCAVAHNATAQEPSRMAVEVITGHAGYVDEVWDNRVMAGGLIRVPISSRMMLGPEFLYQRGPDGAHEWLMTGSATFDLGAARVRRTVTPFIVAAAGVSRRSSLVGGGPGTIELVPYHTYELTASGGIGARLALTRDVFLSADGRLGWEPERRVTVTLGWRPR